LERNLKKFGLLFSKYVFIRSKQFSNGSASVYIYGKRQYVESLDPRITRLPDMGKSGEIQPKAPMDQFGTFEVFVQPKEGKPFEHEGIVHAPNLEMAFVLAKEGFTRRFLCAEPLQRRALAIFERALGPEHPNVGMSLHNLAGLRVAQGRYTEAEPLYRRALAIQEKALGPEHPHTATIRDNLAELKEMQGR
jgi:tetratricopeptide (TPR) repeat protein